MDLEGSRPHPRLLDRYRVGLVPPPATRGDLLVEARIAGSRDELSIEGGSDDRLHGDPIGPLEVPCPPKRQIL
jgi:hypothetical protein